MSRIVRKFSFLALFLGLGIAVVAGGVRAAEGEGAGAAKKPCTIATKGDSPIAKACAEGGLTAAKTAMKDLVKRSKAAGTKFECDECHSDDQKYTLTADAKDKFKKMMAAAGSKK